MTWSHRGRCTARRTCLRRYYAWLRASRRTRRHGRVHVSTTGRLIKDSPRTRQRHRTARRQINFREFLLRKKI